MVTRTKKPDSDEAAAKAPPDFTGTVKDSAQQIWLAGLGAFAKAQQEGSKVFDSLVKDGIGIQRKTQTAAGEKLSEATSRMASMATDISSRASGQWDKLETIFEGRVSKALHKLGVPTAQDIAELSARIDELNRNIGKATGPTGARRTSARTSAQPASKRKPVRKSV